MTKKLKIRFVKFERALVAQQLEMTGKEHFTSSEHVILSRLGIDFADDAIWLSTCDFNIGVRRFDSNDERDEYINKVFKWISEEQFADSSELRIGGKCLFSDDMKDWHAGKYGGMCAEQLGEPRFLELDGNDYLTRWRYVKPRYSMLKIDGDVLTWETEVAQ